MPLRSREKEAKLSIEEARSLLSYDPETGALDWKRPPRRGIAAGPAGRLGSEGYRTVKYRGYEYMSCHLIWFLVTGEWPEHGVDHKNRNRADERWDNLRPATCTQNNHNMEIRKDNRSGVRGVMIDGRSGKFLAQIIANGRKIRLGLHGDLAVAAAARQAAELTHFGEFSPLHGGR